MKDIFIKFIIFLFTVTSTMSEYSLEDCKNLGFNKVNLICSTCKNFLKYDMDKIYYYCKECCIEEEIDTPKQYLKAVLEVCACKFGAYPQIEAFIKSDQSRKYKNLRIKYVDGLDPVIKLYNEDNRVEAEVDIRKWDTDTVDEYLDLHLL